MTAKDEMIHICRTIWSSRTEEQLKGCRNMLKTYIKKHGENVGVTLIEVELARQTRLNGLFANMGKVQKALDRQNKKKLDVAKDLPDNLKLN